MQKIVAQKYVAFLTPFLLMVLFSFFESSILFQFALPYPLVSLLICFVFYFRVFNPQKLNLIFVFLLGLISDFFMAYPLGFQSFALLMGAFLAGFNRRVFIHLSFQKQWLAFVGVFLIILVMNVMLLSVFLDRSVSFSLFFKNFMFISIMYPFLAKGAAYINQKTGVI